MLTAEEVLDVEAHAKAKWWKASKKIIRPFSADN